MREYTARQLRDVAQVLHYNSPTELTIEAAAMLRYAAAMVDRCEAELMLTDKGHHTYSRLNYILRGDAGKEER